MTWSLSGIMAALASAMPVSATTVVYPWPTDIITSTPALVVGYPTAVDYDQAYGRASDKLTVPVWSVFGSVSNEAARDALSATLSGAAEIKAALETDPTLGGVCKTLRVTNALPESVIINGVTYIAIRFTVEVYT